MDEERLSQAESAPQEDASDTQACTPTSPSPGEDERAGTIPPVFLDGEKQGGAEEEGAGRGKADGSAVTIPVRYNHETRALSLDQARVLAQKGMKFDELSPTLEKMKFLAAAEGKSLPELADQLLQRRDQELYNGLLEECYGDEELAKRMFEAEKAKRQARWESAREQEAAAVAQDREELHRRLADQYLELKKLVPDIGEFSRLPRQVIEAAVDGGVSLADAYLRFQHGENQKIAAAKAAREAAARAAAGSQAAGAGENTDPAIDAMLAGIWRGYED